MWVLYDYTGCTPMKLALKQYFPSAFSPLASMSVLLLTSSLTHFSKLFINTCLYPSLSVGISRDRYSVRIVLHPHLPSPTALKLDDRGDFLQKNTPALCNPQKLHWWVQSMLKVAWGLWPQCPPGSHMTSFYRGYTWWASCLIYFFLYFIIFFIF